LTRSALYQFQFRHERLDRRDPTSDRDGVALILTKHARDRMLRDGIKEAWIEAIIRQPEYTMPDLTNPNLTLVWRRIPELGGRFVRVVFYAAGADFVIVTTFLDRGASRRWPP
jgi:hypothetical protein